jgi:hypothetical protein
MIDSQKNMPGSSREFPIPVLERVPRILRGGLKKMTIRNADVDSPGVFMRVTTSIDVDCEMYR